MQLTRNLPGRIAGPGKSAPHVSSVTRGLFDDAASWKSQEDAGLIVDRKFDAP
jgi:hypothetical protein